jgi:hypothetical protein
MGVPQLLIALTIAFTLLVLAYRLGYRNGHRREVKQATAHRGHPSNPRAYRE